MTALLFVAQLATVPAIGLAASTESGVCLAMAAPRLSAGAVVTLVRPDPPQAVVTATVEQALPSCDLERHSVDGPYYRVRLRSSPADDSTIWVAFSGELASRSTPAGIVIRLSAAYPNVRVRDCTSNEGVHYTVWAGEPLKTRRLWHTYYYLNYDAEPSCREQDIHPRFAR